MDGRYALFHFEQLRDRFLIANDLPDGLKLVVTTIKTDDARPIAPAYVK